MRHVRQCLKLQAGVTVVGLFGILLFCSGCATTGFTRFAGDIFLPPDEEIRLGAQLAEQIPNEYTIHPDAEVQAYLRGVGEKIARVAHNDRSDIQYRFTVIDEPDQVNAFAVPGGYIYVFSGLMLFAKDEAELASVLAHEAGHIVARHSANRLGSQIGLSMIASIALGENPSMVHQIVASLATTASMLKFSRDDEREADSLGLKYVVESEYTPQGMVDFMARLMAGREEPFLGAFLSSHPLSSERQASLERELASYGNPSGERRAQQLESIQERLARRVQRVAPFLLVRDDRFSP